MTANMGDTRNIVIIGGGPGGYVAAIRAAQLGADVTLVERDKVGGTCLNVGCVPTKAMLHAGEMYRQMLHGAASYGILASGVRFDWAQVLGRKDAIVTRLVNGVTGLLRKNKVKVVAGEGRLGAGKTVVVSAGGKDAQTLPYDKLIIASGSVPAVPPIPGVKDNPDCIDSTGALSLREVPGELVVIGGGVIGIEFANAYANFGCKVTVLEMMDKILPLMDEQLSAMLRASLEKEGVAIHTGAKVLGVEKQGGKNVVRAELSGKTESYPADKVLVAVGRRTDTAALGLDARGIRHDRGRILVNESMQTNDPDVYAIGDCLGQVMLAHVASAMGEVAAEHAMGHHAAYDGRTNASCVYTSPEFAGTGYTEAELKAKGVEYRAGLFPLGGNAKTIIENGGQGTVKVLVGREFGEILGVHILGPRATDLIAEAALMIGMEATVDEVVATIHAHPTVSEAVREAVLAADGRAIHK
ncbi:MAG TPA: dihydrolipoyl dehydrogenase [Candidatus Limnocylindria bacterium]|nr:dihydrolipoyl dehydrogenase [Candidatus Limnocylindria bacterium]